MLTLSLSCSLLYQTPKPDLISLGGESPFLEISNEGAEEMRVTNEPRESRGKGGRWLNDTEGEIDETILMNLETNL